MELGTKEIMEIIPHRQPFLLIDTVQELEPGVRAKGTKCVSFNEPYFAGHFPGQPVMPGVLEIEALAQLGAVAILSKPEFKGKTAFFACESCIFPHLPCSNPQNVTKSVTKMRVSDIFLL